MIDAYGDCSRCGRETSLSLETGLLGEHPAPKDGRPCPERAPSKAWLDVDITPSQQGWRRVARELAVASSTIRNRR